VARALIALIFMFGTGCQFTVQPSPTTAPSAIPASSLTVAPVATLAPWPTVQLAVGPPFSTFVLSDPAADAISAEAALDAVRQYFSGPTTLTGTPTRATATYGLWDPCGHAAQDALGPGAEGQHGFGVWLVVLEGVLPVYPIQNPEDVRAQPSPTTTYVLVAARSVLLSDHRVMAIDARSGDPMFRIPGPVCM